MNVADKHKFLIKLYRCEEVQNCERPVLILHRDTREETMQAESYLIEMHGNYWAEGWHILVIDQHKGSLVSARAGRINPSKTQFQTA